MKTIKEIMKIKGIGEEKGKKILYSLGISPRTEMEKITEGKETIMNKEITKYKKEEGEEKVRKNNINRQIKLNTWRGNRHKLNYPVNGQRTRSNAATVKRLQNAK